MWKQAENETNNYIFMCRVSNFKQYLKAITSMMTEDRFSDDYEVCVFDYEQWHTYFGTREVDDECEEYEDGGVLTNPCKFNVKKMICYFSLLHIHQY